MLRNPNGINFVDTRGLLVLLSRRFVLMSVCGPTAAILSFASPKESIQRKGDPDAAMILRAGIFDRG